MSVPAVRKAAHMRLHTFGDARSDAKELRLRPPASPQLCLASLWTGRHTFPAEETDQVDSPAGREISCVVPMGCKKSLV